MLNNSKYISILYKSFSSSNFQLYFALSLSFSFSFSFSFEGRAVVSFQSEALSLFGGREGGVGLIESEASKQCNLYKGNLLVSLDLSKYIWTRWDTHQFLESYGGFRSNKTSEITYNSEEDYYGQIFEVLGRQNVTCFLYHVSKPLLWVGLTFKIYTDLNPFALITNLFLKQNSN